MGMNEDNVSIGAAMKTIKDIQVDWQRGKMISDLLRTTQGKTSVLRTRTTAS